MKKYAIASVVAMALLTGCGEKDPLENITKGDSLLSSNQLKGAMIEYKSALQKDATLIDARLGLVKISMKTRDYDGALAEVEKVIERISAQDPQFKEANLLKARALFMNDSSAQVLDIDWFDSAELTYFQVAEYILRDESENAKRLLSKVTDTTDTFYKMSEASILAADGKIEDAVSLIESVTSVSGSAVSPFYLLKTNAMLSVNDMEGAIGALTAYLEEEPGDNSRTLMLANFLIENDQIDEASVLVEKMIEAFPQHGFVNELRAVVAFEKENFELAKSAAALSNVSNPSSVRPRLLSAYSSIRQEKPEEALEQLEFVVDSLPPSHPAKRLYIQLKGSTQGADEVLDEALSLTNLNENDVEILSNMGLSMLRQGRVEEAKQLAEKASSVEGEGESFSSLGLLQLSLNEDNAFDTLESAFQADPESGIAMDSLAMAYLSAGKYDEARSLANEMIAQEKLYEGNMLAGATYVQEKAFSDALSSFEKALSANDEPRVKSVIVDTLVNMGSVEEAKRRIDGWVTDESSISVLASLMPAVNRLNEEDQSVDAAKFIDDQIAKKLSDNSRAQLLTAQSYFLAKQHQVASDKLDALESDFNEEPGYWMLRTTNTIELDNLDKALVEYKSWMSIDKANPMPLSGALRILAAKSQYKEAIALIDENIDGLSNQGPGLLMKVQFLISDRQFAEGKKEYRMLPSEMKENMVAKALKGILDYVDGNYRGAIKNIKPYYDEVGNPEYLKWLSDAYTRSGKKDEAKKLLSDFLEKNQNSQMASFMLGNIFVGEGNLVEANKAYSNGIQDINQSSPVLLNNAAYVKYSLGMVEEGRPLAEKAVSLAPGNASFVDTLANILIEQGESKLASDLIAPFFGEGKTPSESLIETKKKIKL